MTGSDYPERKQPTPHSIKIDASHMSVFRRQEVNPVMTDDKIDAFVEDNLDAYSYLKVNGTDSKKPYTGVGTFM